MTEQEQIETQEEKTPEEILEEMQKNMVPREMLENAERRYNKLFKDVANGKFSSEEETPKSEGEKKEKFKQLAFDIADHKINGSCEQAQAILDIDNYVRERGQRSVFEPSSGERTEDSQRSADNVRDLIQDALDIAQGSDEVFCATIGASLRDINTRR